jgi:hypothetical protein
VKVFTVSCDKPGAGWTETLKAVNKGRAIAAAEAMHASESEHTDCYEVSKDNIVKRLHFAECLLRQAENDTREAQAAVVKALYAEGSADREFKEASYLLSLFY